MKWRIFRICLLNFCNSPRIREHMEQFDQAQLFDEIGHASIRHRDLHTTLTRTGTWLSQDEAEFVDAAFELILPEQRHGDDSGRVEAAHFIEARILAQAECIIAAGMASTDAEICLSSTQVAEVYRSGIAAVQRYCIAADGVRFQDLPVPRQHTVLGLLEQGCDEGGLGPYCALFQLMLQHASEAYFELTRVALQRRRCALRSAAAP